MHRFEKLEGRLLFHNPVITGGSADNRGEVILQMDADSAELSASSFNKNSVQMYEAGPDGILANADDVRVAASVRFTSSNQRLLIRGAVPAGNGYRIKVVSSRIPVSPGFALDGNFTGAFPSGDGIAGGNFEMQVKNDRSATPIARFSTSEGTIDVRLFLGASRDHLATPRNVKNFLSYANAGRYDGLFIHRVDKDFVIQFGGLFINSSNVVDDVQTGDAVQNENGNLNAKYTIATALVPGTGPGEGQNSGTNEFFFNMDNNTSLDDDSNGGPYTVFGEVATSAGRAVLDKINLKNRANLSTQIGNLGSDVESVPVNDGVPVTGQTELTGGTLGKTLDPMADLLGVRRIALRSRIAAL